MRRATSRCSGGHPGDDRTAKAGNFQKEIVEVLRLLTHQKDMDYFDYIRNIRSNPAAKAVKLADLAHNSDETRFAGTDGMDEEQRKRWREKYARAKAILNGEEG